MHRNKITRIIACEDEEEQKSTGKKRKENKANNLFLQKLCILEEAETGMLVSPAENLFESILSLLRSGDHLLLFSYSLAYHHTALKAALAKQGIEHRVVSTANTDEWEATITSSTKMILVQTPTFPLLEVIGLREIACLATRHRLILVVDNSVATPIVQTPLALGADLVMHSHSNWIDGNGEAAGGALLGKSKWIKKLQQHGFPGAIEKNTHLLTYCDALHSAEVRIERQAATAAWLCRKLSYQESIARLHYPGISSHPGHSITTSQMPGGGFAFGIELKGDEEAARRFLSSLQLIKRDQHFGGRSGASHPLSSVPLELQSKEGLPKIPPSLITLTVGLEWREDILQDILSSLATGLARKCAFTKGGNIQEV